MFVDNLKKYRTATGMSQEAFAAKCGMHRTYISAIEEVFLWKTFNVLLTPLKLKHINYSWRKRYEWIRRVSY